MTAKRSRRRAVDLAITSVPRSHPSATAGEVRDSLVGKSFESAVDLAVCNEDRLLGLLPIELLLAADSTATIADLMDEAPSVAGPKTHQELAASTAARTGERTVAITNGRGRFRGLIPPARLLGVLLQEHEEDVARLGGLRAGASVARAAADEGVRDRLWHRLPWLVIGLLGAMASAGIVASFEDQLRSEVLLAVFVPAVVYMADAVGTQTETVVIRGISLGVPIRDVFRRELATGFVIGTLIASAFLAFALLVWSDTEIAATVAVALFVSCSIATLLAMALPYALTRLGRDPAYGSGPLATVIQDLLSIIVYFGVAVIFVD